MGGDMTRSIVIALTLGLLAAVHSFGQEKPSFAGKWILDTQKRSGDPDSGNPLCGNEALVVSHDKKALTTYCSVPVAQSVFSLVGGETTVVVDQTSGKAKANWEGNRIVVTIAVPGASKPLRRVFYLDGWHLVVEQSGGSSGATVKAYFLKS